METKVLKHYGVDVEVTYIGETDMYKELVKTGIKYIDIPNIEFLDVISYFKDGIKKYLIQAEGFWYKTLSVPDDGSWSNLVRDMKNQYYGADAEIMLPKLAHDLQIVKEMLYKNEVGQNEEDKEFDDSFSSFGIRNYTKDENDEYWYDVILELKSTCGWTKERILKADKNKISKKDLEMIESHL